MGNLCNNESEIQFSKEGTQEHERHGKAGYIKTINQTSRSSGVVNIEDMDSPKAFTTIAHTLN